MSFLLAKRSDETELSRLLQLVLGCAVSCDRKQFYIEHIMSLEASDQIVLMNAIQEVRIDELKFHQKFDFLKVMVKENRKVNDEYSELGDQVK